MEPQETGNIFDILGLPETHRARLLLRPMSPVKGVKRTLVMGVVEGDLCPDSVDRRVNANIVVTILTAERAKRRMGRKTESGRPMPEGSYATDDFSHGSLLQLELNSESPLWERESENSLEPPASTPSPTPLPKKGRKKKVRTK